MVDCVCQLWWLKSGLGDGESPGLNSGEYGVSFGDGEYGTGGMFAPEDRGGGCE